MRILYHHRIASKDGQFVHIDELTRALKRQGHEIVMVAPRGVESAGFGADGGLVSGLKRYIPGALYELMEFSYGILAFVKLCVAIRKFRPDCIYERYNLYLLSGVWASRVFRLPLLLEVNAPLFDERTKYNGIALPRLARWTERTAWRSADAVLPVTRVLAKTVEKAGVDPARITVIHNGIDPGRFEAPEDGRLVRQELGLEDSLVLGFTGFVREWHRLDRVLELLSTGADGKRRHLLLVGDGPARRGIEARARSLGVEKQLTVTGIVERDTIARYVSCFDIALQPDVVPYASPLKMFEYMALARPIVAPDTENIREILVHEKSALLFDPGHPDAFLSEVERLLGDAGLRKRLGEEARQQVFDRGFTWDSNARRVADKFHELICPDGGRGGGGPA